MRCPVCNQIFNIITPSHAKKHGYANLKEFVQQYPEVAPYTFYAQKNPTTRTYSHRSRRVEMAIKAKTYKNKEIDVL